MRGRVKPSLHQTVARAETAASTNTGSLSHGERAGVRGRVKPSLHQTVARADRGIEYWLPLPWGEGWGEGSGQTRCRPSPAQETAASTNTGSLSHGERAGVRGRVAASDRRPRRNRGTPNTGSLSHGERAGVRGRVKPSLHQTSPAQKPRHRQILAPSPMGRGLG